METRIHWAWVILAVCFCNLFINYSVRLGYGVILPEMIRELDFSRTAAGSIFNAYLLTYVALTPLTGFLTDRLGARRIITVCALILGVGILLMGRAEGLWSACAFYGVVGLGATGMWTPVITVVQRWFVQSRRGMALGLLSTGYGLGFATMGAAFPWILHHFTWRHAWYFLGCGALVMVAANALLLRSTPESRGLLPWGGKDPHSSPSPTGGGSTPFRLRSNVFGTSVFWIIGCSYLCITYSLYGITTFMVDYAVSQRTLPIEKASLLATVHGACQVLGVLTVLPLSDILGRKRTLVLSNAFIAASLAGLLVPGVPWWMLFVLVGVLAAFYGVTFPLYGACAGDHFPKEVMGTVIGAWTPFYGSGAIAAHWVSGYLRDATGTYDRAFMINALMAAAGLLLMALVGKPGSGRRAEGRRKNG
jgi:sugar phosphate permease